MKRLNDLDDLAGKTVRRGFDTRHGIVLVFDDNDWCVIEGVEDEPGSPSASIEARYSGRFDDIKLYLDPDELVAADLLTTEQAKFLRAQLAKEAAEHKRARAKSLLAEADKLSPEIA